jgi:hypothetical protein
MNSSDKIVIYDWHSVKSPAIWLMGLFCFICAIGAASFLLTDAPKMFSLGLAVAFVIGGFGCLSRCKTTVNLSKQTLVQETLFLNRVLYWRRNFQFSDFSAIEINQRIGGDRDNCFVGLHRLSGRKLWITYFENTTQGFTSSKAKDFAEQLSRDLQLPIKTIG